MNEQEEANREKWFARLKSGLVKSRKNLVTKVTGVF